MHGLPNSPILAFGRLEDERGDVGRLLSIYPRGVPKWSLRTVPNRDGGTGVEKVEVLLITRVPSPDPQLCGLLPLIPKPS